MEYITVKEASELWHMDISTIGKLLRSGKVIGARKIGGHWLILKDSSRPIDGRTRAAKETNNEATFRFPLYINFPEDSYTPPLSTEESQLRQAQSLFYACDFQKAKDLFEYLALNAINIYVKSCAMFYMCVLSAVYNININWEKCYFALNYLLSEDYSFKKEMLLFLPWLDFITGQFGSIPEKLNTDPSYDYHPSSWYMNAFLSIINFNEDNLGTINKKCSEPFETLWRIMERDGYYVEAQELHMVLFMHHYSNLNHEAMNYHLRKAIQIAYEHNLIFAIADAEAYYSDAINAVLCEYPDSFANLIRNIGKKISVNFTYFSGKSQEASVYARLSQSDFPYVFYALKRYTNKQVAEICKISERTVANKYNDIYNKLGVNSKQELIQETYTSFKYNSSDFIHR